MKKYLFIIFTGVAFIGCASNSQNISAWQTTTYQATQEKIAKEREKDLLFKQKCSQQGGVLDTKHETIGLYYCQIGQSKIQNNSEGYLALSSSLYDKNGYDKNGFNINGLHKDTLTKFDKNGKNKNGLTQQELMQKEYNDKMMAFEKEKLELEKQKLIILKQQADDSSFKQSMESLLRQQQDFNEYSKRNQQNLDNLQKKDKFYTPPKKDTYYITPMGNGFYIVN